MHILCVGISHRTAPVELRERIALSAQVQAAALRELHAQWPHTELAVISTCNRTEFYLARPLHGHPRLEEVVEYLARSRQVASSRLEPAIYHHDNDKAVAHLMRVACGLDSMVLGESQILGQVREAYDRAQAAGTVGRVMHKLFQSALAAGKQVRAETGIGQGRTSVSSVAVDFARHLFSHFQDKTLLVIGAGKMTELTLRHFAQLRPGRVVICNRSLDKAHELAHRCHGKAEPFDRLRELLIEADLVISSTGSDRAIVTAEVFRPLLRLRKFRPIFVIDIAVPRDFDPAIGDLDSVYLYDMDDLQQAVADQMSARGAEAEACEQLVRQAAAESYAAIQMADYATLIQKLRGQLHAIGDEETRRTLNKLRAVGPQEAERLLQEHTQRVVNKILHRPLSELGRGSGTEAAMNATALRRLFALDEKEDLSPPESTPPGED